MWLRPRTTRHAGEGHENSDSSCCQLIFMVDLVRDALGVTVRQTCIEVIKELGLPRDAASSRALLRAAPRDRRDAFAARIRLSERSGAPAPIVGRRRTLQSSRIDASSALSRVARRRPRRRRCQRGGCGAGATPRLLGRSTRRSRSGGASETFQLPHPGVGERRASETTSDAPSALSVGLAALAATSEE